MNNKQRIEAAKDTLQIMDAGFYTNRHGMRMPIDEALRKAEDESVLYKPDDFPFLFEEWKKQLPVTSRYKTGFEVTSETTMLAMERLNQESGKIIALNFASAKNPGGGFLSGSQAQEESLARSSGLYNCLTRCSMMYTVNRKLTSCLYTDYMIYSPQVPFFKNDDGELLDAPYLCSVLTVPAVNAGAVMQNEPDRVNEIKDVMFQRTEKLLMIAALKKYETLVLGAWGCGVFRNAPAMVADCFHYHLKENPLLTGVFKKVVFAVLDRFEDHPILTPFKNRFGA